MDNQRFDDLARSVAGSTDRRRLIKTLLGSLFGGIGLLAGSRAQEASAAPAMTLNPTSGKIKTSVVATITGFKSAETITLLWFDGAVSKSIAAGLTNGSGNATITFTTPYAFRGYHVVRAQGNKGSVADAKFAIVPSFTLKPKKGPAGTATKASLSGYAKGATIDVYFFTTADNSGASTKLASAVVSGTGTGAANFTIPNNASLGIHRVEGRERVSGRVASAKFVVTCTSASQCPGSDGDCAHRSCTNGVCGMANEPAGTQCTGGVCDENGVCVEAGTCQTPFDCPGQDTDCAARICEQGVCGFTFTSEGTPVTNQVAGDCQKLVCDGAGNVVSIADDTDVPDDGNECTDNICQNGNPAFVNHPEGTQCAGGICDGNGACVTCLPGSTEPCFSGPPGSENLGICQAGIRTCLNDGSGWGACVGEILPQQETCNGLDDDCDGQVDEGFLCPDVPNGTSACVHGECMTVECDSGYALVNGVCCQSQALACAGKDCGTVVNDCGQTIPCGVCGPGEICFDGICLPN